MATEKISSSVKSDELSDLRRFFKDYPGIEIFTQLFQLSVIIDANVIIADLIWLTKLRNNPEARTSLQEVIASETLMAVAPKWLEEEIQENIPEISEKENIPRDELLKTWADYRKYIEFKTAPDYLIELPNNIHDPDDLPYLLLQMDTGHVIYSKDSDLKSMNAQLIDSTVIMTMRDYSRNEAIELTILSGSLLVTAIGFETIKLIWNLFHSSIKAFYTLPSWIKYTAVVFILGILIHPSSRSMIINYIKSGSDKAPEGFYKLVELLEPMINEFKEAQIKSDQNLSDLLSSLPSTIDDEG